MKIDDLEVYGIIYKIKNLKNNKIYIGQTNSKYGFKGRYYRSGKNFKKLKLKYLKIMLIVVMVITVKLVELYV